VGVECKFLEQGKGAEILATGVVRGQEVIAALREIYDPRHLDRQEYQIVDKSHCTEYAVTADEIATIAEVDRQASLVNPNIVIAVIESHHLQFSLTELWQAHLGDCVFPTKSFQSRGAAMQWIAEHRVGH